MGRPTRETQRRKKMGRLSFVLCLMLAAMSANEVWAKRAAPKPVAPVVHNGVKFVAPNLDGCEGKIEAINESNGKKLWDVVIYRIKIDPHLEKDVQWVFITKLAIRQNTLQVTTEKNEQFNLDLTTRKVEKVTKGKKEK
jgi:hypothetical protein